MNAVAPTEETKPQLSPFDQLKAKFPKFVLSNPTRQPQTVKLFGDSVQVMPGGRATIPSNLLLSMPTGGVTLSNVSMKDLIEVGLLKRAVAEATPTPPTVTSTPISSTSTGTPTPSTATSAPAEGEGSSNSTTPVKPAASPTSTPPTSPKPGAPSK